jgi:two-component system, chemotaxis family, sensor kinase CheA
MNPKSQYKEVFLEEANEQIDLLNQLILEMENNPLAKGPLYDVFRIAHTLKSSAAFVGLSQLSSFLHKLENLLQRLTEDKIRLSRDIVDVMLESFDQVKLAIDEFAAQDDVFQDFSANLSHIEKILEGESTESPTSKEKSSTSSPPASSTTTHTPSPPSNDDKHGEEDKIEFLTKELLDKARVAIEEEEEQTLYLIVVQLVKDAPLKWLRCELILNNLHQQGKILGTYPEEPDLKSDALKDRLDILICSSAEQTMVDRAVDVDQVARYFIIKTTIENLENYILTGLPVDLEAAQEEVEQDVAVSETSTEPGTPDSKPETPQASQTPKRESQSSILRSQQAQTVRVPISKLDELMNWVGELAIVSSGFIDIGELYGDREEYREILTELQGKTDHLTQIARNLQEGIMHSRMVPISTVFSRFTRIVRDLSNEMNKPIQLQLEGEDTELDKKIIDSLAEPLIHLVRNAIDHGIESTEEREAAGKNPNGHILMNAYQRGGRIFVDVTDDGRGLDKEKIVRIAVERELIEKEDAHAMTDSAIYELIFMPGFSTKEQVSEISGRGVGMGVVEETLKNLNGSIHITSEVGKGTTFSLAFPLTLAIISVLLVKDENDVFALPLLGIEGAYLTRQEKIETVDQHLVVRLRNRVIPVMPLAEILGFKRGSTKKDAIVIIEYENAYVGIMVDELRGKREVVVKALGQEMNSDNKGLAGAAILGNGQIALILDLPDLIKRHKAETAKFSKILQKQQEATASQTV